MYIDREKEKWRERERKRKLERERENDREGMIEKFRKIKSTAGFFHLPYFFELA